MHMKIGPHPVAAVGEGRDIRFVSRVLLRHGRIVVGGTPTTLGRIG
jgi:hypothetical protein